MASDASDIISRLARMLFERRHQAIRPYTLVLGSDVLPIREMEDSVIRFSSGLEQARIDGLSPGARSESLRRAWQSVQSDQLAAVNLIDAALPLQNDKNPTLAVESIYAPLIGLIKRGYFTTIVSADFTTELEDTLVAEGMQFREFRVFANGRFNVAEVQQLLDRPHPAIRIIKVYGELHDKFAFTSDEKAAWTNEWRSGLERWLASPLLVVGYNPDCDQWPLTASTLLQYVNTALPARGTDVYRLLDARSLLDDCITGPEGVPGHFWSQLRIKIDALDKAQE